MPVLSTATKARICNHKPSQPMGRRPDPEVGLVTS